MWRVVELVTLNHSAHRGVTLIELVVTITILALLALAAVQLGQSWIANSRIVETHGKMQTVFEKAQSFAVRNPNGVIGANSAVNLTMAGGFFVATSSAGDVVWQERIDPRATVTFASGCGSIGVNNQGRLLIPSCNAYTIEFTGGNALNGQFN